MKSPSLHYYVPALEAVSFHRIGVQYAHHLTKLGWDVDVRPLEGITGRSTGGFAALWHPLLYLTQKSAGEFTGRVSEFAAGYKHFFGMEVADSTRISERFVQWANLDCLSGIFLPSRFSIKAFAECGVKTPLALVPHGFTPVEPSGKFDFLKERKGPKSLSFMVHDSHRKGWDILLKTLSERPEITFVVKGPSLDGRPFTEERENILIINHWLNDADLASLYLNCDFLYSPHRGGAFEMNCLEAACYGLPVVASGHGAVTEYLRGPAHIPIRISEEKPLWPSPNDHCGLGAEPALAEALAAVDEMCQTLAARKEAAQGGMAEQRADYSWERVTGVLDQELKRRL